MRWKGIFNITFVLVALYAFFALVSWDIWIGDWHWLVRLIFIVFSLKAVSGLIEDGMI